jgi:hypothetical protein
VTYRAEADIVPAVPFKGSMGGTRDEANVKLLATFILSDVSNLLKVLLAGFEHAM